ncbi:MAG: exodeoxyribonuclease VII small subunit [Bacilli bacterium]|nr:exodeoxyribonuclease VII small subunit [Bacilli bacterium]
MENKTFEENLARLKEVVRLIQSGELNLDESIEVFKEGIELSKYLEEKLSSIENKAIKLFENNELKDFNGEE